VADGVCSSDGCAGKNLFLLIFFFGIFFTFMNATPASIIEMRCIPTHHSAISLALGDVLTKILGSTWGPLYFAAFMDAACRVKSISMDEYCEVKESCAIFDNEKMFTALSFWLSFIFKLGSIFFCTWCYQALRGTPEGEESYDKHVVDKSPEKVSE